MKSIHLFYFLACLLVAQACKPNSTTQEEKSDTDKKDVDAADNTSHVSGGHDQTFLTDKLFHFKASNTVGAKEDLYAGQWIDLMPDGTYKAGKLKEQTHTGHWDFYKEGNVLLLRPDDTNFKRSEWKVMHNADMVVLVGTQTYGNNATQIQLIRSNDLP